jgi:hypothetical protein
MHSEAQYREYAQECIDSARTATSQAVRVQFLELAQLWLAAATHAELRAAAKASVTRLKAVTPANRL